MNVRHLGLGLTLVACKTGTPVLAPENAASPVAAEPGADVPRRGSQGRGVTADAGEGSEQLARIESRLVSIEARLQRLEEERAAAPRRAPARAVPDPKHTYRAEVGAAPVKGPRTALVTVVIWADFQGPFCARVQPTLRNLLVDYRGDIRLVFKHNPLPMHNRAMPAAIAAEAAHRQNKFWQMHDKMFANHRGLTDENIRKWAKGLRLDMKRFERDRRDLAIRRGIEDDQKQGMLIGARGTPAFFINGRFLSGAQPIEAFKKLIDEELADAYALVGRGVPRHKIYDEVMKGAKTKLERR